MIRIQFLICLLFVLFYRLGAKNFHPGLYQPDKHHMTILNADNYKKILFEEKSNVLYFVEFYAHWCGTCVRYAPIWIELAKEAKLWKNVVKFAALNCGDPLNSRICDEFEIIIYPTIRLFPLHPQFSPPMHGGRDFNLRKKEYFLVEILEIIEKYDNPTWPNLKTFK